MVKKKFPPAKFPVSDQELQLLGEIAVHMAIVEFHVNLIIAYLLHLTEEDGLLITGPMQLNQKSDLLLSLIKQLPKEDRFLVALHKLLDGLRTERNRKIHAFWVWFMGERCAMVLGSDRRSWKHVPVTTEDIIYTRDSTTILEAMTVRWLTKNRVMRESSRGRFFLRPRRRIHSRSPTQLKRPPPPESSQG
jgi:hypothetical protein